MKLKELLLAALGATALLAGDITCAASVSLVDQSYTVGAAGGESVNSFTLFGPQALTVTLSDIPWPQSLASISFEITNAAGQVYGQMNAFGSETVQLTAPGTYYALAYGVAAPAATPLMSFGSYGLQISTVPLPPAASLLAAALALVWLVARRRNVRRLAAAA